MTNKRAKTAPAALKFEAPERVPEPRELTRAVQVGNVIIGGDYPVSIQTMLSLSPSNTAGCLSEINQLHSMGCDLVRLAVTSEAEAHDIKAICTQSPLPIIADIQFDYKLALASIAAGVAKVRLNPGNIGGEDKFRAVIAAAKAAGVALRLGINSGSIDKALKAEGYNSVPALVESAQRSAAICEEGNFTNYIISAKASNSSENISTNLAIARQLPQVPLHLGLTEAGLTMEGGIKSAYSVGRLLQMGIGNTIRISLTAPVAEEIYAAKALLHSAGLRKSGFELISCPTCSRVGGDVKWLAQQLQVAFNKLDTVNYLGVPATNEPVSSTEKTQKNTLDSTLRTRTGQTPTTARNPAVYSQESGKLGRPIKIAVMGCVVNGPGESKESDIGVTFGANGNFLVFKQGRVVPSDQLKNMDDVAEFVLKSLQ